LADFAEESVIQYLTHFSRPRGTWQLMGEACW